MNRLIILFISLSFFKYSYTQFQFGLIGGINYDSTGKIELLEDEILDYSNRVNSVSGYHLGLYSKIDLPMFYISPKLQFTWTKNDYKGSKFNRSRIEMPLSIGYKAWGPMSFFIGPTAYLSLSNNSKSFVFENLKNDINYGFHVGAQVSLGMIGINIGYQKAFSKMETKILEQNGTKVNGIIDMSPNQYILGISFKLNHSESK